MKRLSKAICIGISALTILALCSCGKQVETSDENKQLLSEIEQLGNKTVGDIGIKDGRYAIRTSENIDISSVDIEGDKITLHNTGLFEPEKAGEHYGIGVVKEEKKYSSGIALYSLNLIEYTDENISTLEELKDGIKNNSINNVSVVDDLYKIKVLKNDKITINDYDFELVVFDNKEGKSKDTTENGVEPENNEEVTFNEYSEAELANIKGVDGEVLSDENAE